MRPGLTVKGAILFKMGLASKRKMHPMKVGIHRKNRGGVLAHSLEAPRLMGDIADQFWNPEECVQAICVEIEKCDFRDEDVSATGVNKHRLTPPHFYGAVSRLFHLHVRTPIAAYGRFIRSASRTT